MFKRSGAKVDRYEKKGEADGIENLSEKLSLDLRKCIKNLGSFAVLSSAWFDYGLLL